MICFPMNLLVSFSKTVYFIQNWNPTQDAVRTRMYLWMGTLQHSMKFLANISRLELAVYPQGRCRGRFNPLCNKISKLEWLLMVLIQFSHCKWTAWRHKLISKSGFWWCWFNFHIANGPHGDHGKRYTTCPTAYPKGTRSVFQNQIVSNKCFLTTPSVPERP